MLAGHDEYPKMASSGPMRYGIEMDSKVVYSRVILSMCK
jgi:hypothetical protein